MLVDKNILNSFLFNLIAVSFLNLLVGYWVFEYRFFSSWFRFLVFRKFALVLFS